jgi:chromosome segregation ATPase
MKVPAICCALLLTFGFECSAQTLADRARHERERQKGLHSTRVIINGATTGTSASSSAPAASVKAPQSPPNNALVSGPLDNQGHDEKYWRTQFAKARDAVKKSEDNVQLLDLKVKEMNTQLLRQSDIYNREYRLGPQIAESQQQLDDARKQLDDAKKKLADLEDDLRHAGGPPGWAR